MSPTAAAAAVKLPAPPAPDFARRLGVSPEKVITWIKSGELVAVDVSMKPGVGKPRYRIDPAEIESFLSRRSVRPAIKPMKRRRAAQGVTEYF